MRIGELAARAGVTTRTLRHYESVGLLSARRTGNGYRDYDGADLRVVAEIRALVGLGFALEETRPFVQCLRAGHDNAGTCADSLAVYRQKLAEVDGYLARLHEVRDRIEAQFQQALADRGAPRCEFAGESA
jgi:DNA-binding transcriptional MerR regulator